MEIPVHSDPRNARRSNMKPTAVRCALLFVAYAVTTCAQGSATVAGTVTDPSGAAVPAVEVKIVAVDTGATRNAFTNAQGQYVIPSLSPARYTLSAETAGFRRYVQENIVLQADQKATVNIRLELGQTTETVTVRDDAPQVDTQSGALSQVVEQKRIVDLPLNGRNAAELTLLVAGAIRTPNSGIDQGVGKTFPGVIPISTNGSRQNQISYNLDGGNHVDEYTIVSSPFPFPDALREFSVQTSNYSAEHGQNAGGVVNVVTRSGTNSFHGGAFGFVRNKVFNARNFFAADRDNLKRAQLGMTGSGPVILPGYSGRDRTFFFAGYQGTRLRNVRRGLSAFVPTDANLTGDFSALLDPNSPQNPLGRVVRVNDPVTRQPFPDNRIPASRFDPAAIKFLQFVPRAGGNGRIQYDRGVRDDFNEVLYKVDHHISGSDTLSFRHFLDDQAGPTNYDGVNILTLDNFSAQRHQDLMLAETHIFSPNLLNEFRFNYTRTSSDRGQPADVPTVNDFGVNIWSPIRALQSVSVTGFFSAGAGAPAQYVRNGFNWANTTKWIRGRHTLSLGGTFARSRVDFDNYFNSPGVFGFTNDVTNYGIASLLLGKLRTFRQATGAYMNDRNSLLGLFVQDTFRVTSRFTLDWGLRWDPFFPWKEIRGRMVLFRPDAYSRGEKSRVFDNALPGLFYPALGDPGPETGVTSDLNNFAPRLGFAFDPKGDGKTSIRGGGGVFYNSRMPAQQPAQIVQVTPLVAQLTLTDPQGPFSNPYLGIQNPFPAPFPPPRDAPFPQPVLVSSFSPTGKFPTPVVYNWNLTIERQLGGNWLARAAYVGSHGSHLQTNLNINNAVYIPESRLGTDQRRRFTDFSNIFLGSQEGNSSYNSLQLTLSKRFSTGNQWLDSLTLLSNYTYAKSIDDLPLGQGQTTFGPGNTQALPYDDPNRKRFERGPSEFDRTHRLVLSYAWELPLLAGASPLTHGILGGWQVTGIVQAQTGAPLDMRAGRDQSGTGLGQDRVDYLGGDVRGSGGCGPGEAPCVNFLNPAAFGLPVVGAFGSLGKGAVRGPGFWNWDMGFFKDFPIEEFIRVQFRFEFFNIFNRVNLGDPQSSFSSAGFGGVRSAGDPRIGQVALKLLF
jgi:hypothetical protein